MSDTDRKAAFDNSEPGSGERISEPIIGDISADTNVIVQALGQIDDSALYIQLKDLHPADFSDQFEQLSPPQREQLIDRAGGLITADVLAELEDEIVEDILPLLPAAQIARAITTLDSDDATQIVEEMEPTQLETVLDALAEPERAVLEASLSFDEETIGRLMQREFVAAPPFWTVGNAIDHMRATGEELPDLFFNIYVIDTGFHPIGYIPVSRLMRAQREESLETIMERTLVTISQDKDQEEAAFLFEKYNLISAPVTDSSGRIVGMMTVDDVIEIIQDENKEDILALAGVSEAGLTDTAFSILRSRWPWLLINLLTAVLASIVISQFDYAITEIVALAVLMPIVASMGGNAGTQALTVAVRALSERDLTSQTAWRAIRRESFAAIMIGFIFASIMFCISWLWFQDIRLSIVVFLAMIINHICAGIAGILIPLGLKRVGADPAVASSVFVTTVTDIVGFFAFLGLAVIWLL